MRYPVIVGSGGDSPQRVPTPTENSEICSCSALLLLPTWKRDRSGLADGEVREHSLVLCISGLLANGEVAGQGRIMKTTIPLSQNL